MQQPHAAQRQSVEAQLYQQYAPTIFAYILRQVASRDDAEDLLLEVFLAILEQKSSVALDEQQLQRLIWTIARNKVVDHYRRQQRRPSVPLNDVEGAYYTSEELAPEQVALKNEEYRQLHTTLKTLPDFQREILRLRFGHGLRCGEIATILAKSEGAVRVTLHRTLK